ncbi:hypothetical protein [Phenylobacterium sp.]|uniref:hypothetical protein n=1 Tax=Phenylobacterium sp. TaxID=1871053 RepID=UPI002F421E84
MKHREAIMDWTWVKFAATAVLLAYVAGPRIATGFFFLIAAAVAFGANSWLAAAVHQTPVSGALLRGAPFFLQVLAAGAAGIVLGWALRRWAPSRIVIAPRVTREP